MVCFFFVFVSLTCLCISRITLTHLPVLGGFNFENLFGVWAVLSGGNC